MKLWKALPVSDSKLSVLLRLICSLNLSVKEDKMNDDESNRSPKPQSPMFPWKYFCIVVPVLLIFGIVVANHFSVHLQETFSTDSPSPYQGLFKMLDTAATYQNRIIGDTDLDVFKKTIFGETHTPGICQNLVSSLERNMMWDVCVASSV